ncbi:Gfo/Idh/MocA family protein [Cyclobacterium jeungdonense]|uniref:Gfo/Idh/MocA family oxidoreductase n=1 Tax=Cyclobacterium jeungdonense TaxID=708087 RepID=A0ABT8CBC1_9BACT|nr:Gfo/Idh/MocA family oxidoreductase [Cyclobacterium jeungdonense]MDN3688888.1 Gfo/Idh/MocA family oxidoreductase [Cyclobacterium jeungdonense]
MVNIGIIGYGYWGPNLVRNFFSANDCRIKSVADARPERLQELNKIFPSIQRESEAENIIFDPGIDAIVIATPVFTHFLLAKKAILEGKHVLIEKPMTSSVKEAEILMNLAEQKQVLLMVDHTFLYTGAVQKIKQLLTNQELGTINYLDSTRINLGLFQSDINVLWDLAPHDISILNYLVNERPYSVNATGISHTGNNIENIAYLTVNYASGFIAHFNCSWTSPVKVRMMLIGGNKKMILYNDLEPTEKIKVYNTGYSFSNDEERKQVMVDYRTGDIHVPKLETTEALLGMANDFIQCILDNKKPRSNSNLGLDVVKILEGSAKSIKNHGHEVKLESSILKVSNSFL